MKPEYKSPFQVVPDTNIILSSELSGNRESPNREFIDRWLQREFAILFSDDTKMEYTIKLMEKEIPKELIIAFLANLNRLGTVVAIDNYHLHHYPEDEDDICFVLCAENGGATHLVSYDIHLLALAGKFQFEILKIVPFLKTLRSQLNAGTE